MNVVKSRKQTVNYGFIIHYSILYVCRILTLLKQGSCSRVQDSLSRELRTASSRGRHGERRQCDPCLKHTYKNTTCWPATAYNVTTGANHSIKGRRENTSSSSSSSMTVLFEACILLVRTIFYCYYGEH